MRRTYELAFGAALVAFSFGEPVTCLDMIELYNKIQHSPFSLISILWLGIVIILKSAPISHSMATAQ